MDTILERIKALLGFNSDETDEARDNVLNILIDQAMATICIYLGINFEEFPVALDFIAEQMVIVRYNRLGAEGITTEKIDVLSTTYSYNVDELAPYKKVLDNYILHFLDSEGNKYKSNKYNGRFKML